jgi:hypothetical protein
MSFVAAVNATLSADPNPTEHLPFNYVPTGWVGITFITLFIITTGGFIFSEYFLSSCLLPASGASLGSHVFWHLVHGSNSLPLRILRAPRMGWTLLGSPLTPRWQRLSHAVSQVRQSWRIKLNQSPFRICTTIIALSFMTAAMFLILPKVINELGTEYSHMPANLCKRWPQLNVS